MFTGLVEEVATVRRLERQGDFQRLHLAARTVVEDARIGDSININGACQTIVDLSGDGFAVESVEETLKRTTLGDLKPGDAVNLERSLRPTDRLGGHLVLGHVDGVGRIRALEQRQRQWLLQVEAPAPLRRYIATKGSVTVDGISLTVAEAGDEAFTIAVIPHTFEATTLCHRRLGDRVNLEVDLIARYLERLLDSGRPPRTGPEPDALSLDALRRMGY